MEPIELTSETSEWEINTTSNPFLEQWYTTREEKVVSFTNTLNQQDENSVVASSNEVK